MMRLPVVAALLISALVVVAMFGWAYLTIEKDLMKPQYAVWGMFVGAGMYNILRIEVASMMERCTTSGVMGPMMIMIGLLTPDVGWVVGGMCIGAGIFVILSPYLFKERWERSVSRDS